MMRAVTDRMKKIVVINPQALHMEDARIDIDAADQLDSLERKAAAAAQMESLSSPNGMESQTNNQIASTTMAADLDAFQSARSMEVAEVKQNDSTTRKAPMTETEIDVVTVTVEDPSEKRTALLMESSDGSHLGGPKSAPTEIDQTLQTSDQPSPRNNKSMNSTAAGTTITIVKDNEHRQKRRFVTPKDFDLLKVIGMGAFGKVLQVRNKHSGDILAMKVISKRLLRRKGRSYIENVSAERNILTRVHHPFVVTMHCSFQSKEKLFLIMDFLAGGELFLRLGREGIFLEKTARFYLAEIILALDHLHSRGILHRDLKPENILLGSDGHVCLTDFGLAKDFGEGGFDDDDEREIENGGPGPKRALTICGTQEYMAPEMVARQGYGRAADYWSLGCIAYEMLAGLPPFRSKLGAKDLFRKIMTEKVKMPSLCSADACKLIKGLLNRNVQKRFGTTKSTMFEVGGVAGLRNIPFFKPIDWDKLAQKEIPPPDVFAVESDSDAKHFHEEFTNMALPRSVVEISRNDSAPKKIQSEAFRGFSFIHDDFTLPERGDQELQSYWDAVEEDGESLSDCASSKLDVDESQQLEEPTSQKKKRPPRKRKKKKAGDIPNAATSAANTPAPSRSVTPTPSAAASPVPSENGDSREKVEANISSDPNNPSAIAKSPKDPTLTTKGNTPTPGMSLNQPSSVSLSSQKSTPTAPPLPRPTKPVEPTWQGVAKKKNVSACNTLRDASGRSSHPKMAAPPAFSSQKARLQQPQRITSKTPSAATGWGSPPPRTGLPTTPTTPSRPTVAGWNTTTTAAAATARGSSLAPVVAAPPFGGGAAAAAAQGRGGYPSRAPSPMVDVTAASMVVGGSSDWRQHRISPHSASSVRSIRKVPSGQPSWPSLSLATTTTTTAKAPTGAVAAATTKPTAKPQLKGAWATRK